MKKYIAKKHWYLGFLGLIGFYELPHVIQFFNGDATAWSLLGLLWFLWFDYFVPSIK
ncbi:MAG: hypothetical protein MI974_20520 [Chitinophagales bacterium]|nr:hypothetical protein [Chitinophagales bacterium]